MKIPRAGKAPCNTICADAWPKSDQYALANLLYYPARNVMAGLEFQKERRPNFSDGFAVDDFRLQFSGRYNFSLDVGGGK